LGLTHVVVTSVTRDDLPDGGASSFADSVDAIHRTVPGASVELLIPDFGGSRDALDRVVRSEPDVVGHNVETTQALYSSVRRGADYRRSLDLLRRLQRGSGNIRTKSGVMVGLGETRADLRALFQHLCDAGVSIVTIGQYLRPTRRNIPPARFVEPDEFEDIAWDARNAGIPHVAAGPLVRSSYRAKEVFIAARGAPADRGPVGKSAP
jgi:lipoic acid synthetase